MRGIGGLFLGLGLWVFLPGASATAQQPTKTKKITVIIGADGSIKVLDVTPGKPIGGAAAKPQPAPGQDLRKALLEQHRQELEKLAREFERAKDLAARQAELEKARQALERAQQKAKAILEARPPFHWHYHPGAWQYFPWNGPGDILKKGAGPGKQTPAGVDQKLDLILKQLGDLRRDVDAIKKKVDARPASMIQPGRWIPRQGKNKKDAGGSRFQLVPAPQAGKDKKPGVIEIELVPSRPVQKSSIVPKVKAERRIIIGGQPSPELLRKIEEIIKQIEREASGKPVAPRIQIIPLPAKGAAKPIDPIVLDRLDRLILEIENKQRGQAPNAGEQREAERQMIDAQRQLERILQQIKELERKNRP
ncbi:MAG: hypothetical protein HYX68_12530 [Planctomycetes bacterium]|nr:hypothetical protein [Planctomycetota bacterium]